MPIDRGLSLLVAVPWPANKYVSASQWERLRVRSVAARWNMSELWEREGSATTPRFPYQVRDSNCMCKVKLGSMDKYFIIQPNMKDVVRRLSFVWAGLSKYCVIDCVGVYICNNRVFCIGTVVDGAPPECCVSGSGSYVCDSGKGEFLLYLKYLDIVNTHGGVFYEAIIDDERTVLSRA